MEVDVPKSWLPEGVREGTYLQVDFSVDHEATERAHGEVQSLLDELGNEP